MKKIVILLMLLLLAISCAVAYAQFDDNKQQDNTSGISNYDTDTYSQNTTQQELEQSLSLQETTTTMLPTTTSATATTITSTTKKTATTTESQQTITTPETACWVNGSVVNFRKESNEDCEVLTKLTRGTEIVKLGENGEWIYARHDNLIGYIHGDYVSLFPLPDPDNGEVRIIVKKSQRILELWQGDLLIGSYSIGLGWEPVGHKQVEGDGRTPEGEYYVCLRNGNSRFYKSLGVSYPNKTDAAAALEDGRIDQSTYNRIARAIDRGECPDWYTAMGGNILIHGLGETSDWTAGCVGVDNDVMDILYDYCPIGTRITILP